MKRILLVLAVAVLLLIPMAVYAHGGSPPRPPQPTCPEGYNTEKEAEWVDGECSCPTFTWPEQKYNKHWVGGWNGHWEYDYFGPITFTYDKSNDPNKCHRPTASSLGVPSKLVSDFNHDFKEWKDADCEPGYWTEPVCELPPPPVEGCTDSKALNYDPEAEVDDGSCEYPPPPVCEWDESIPADDPGCEFCLIFPEDESCETPPPVCEWDETIPADDPGCEFCLFFPEDETCKTPPPSKKKVCEPDEIGRLFELKSETGQSCWLASYQRHPLTGDWALPRIEEQLCQCGFIAVDVDDHEDIVRDCNGDVNIQTVHLSCIGGAGGGSCN